MASAELARKYIHELGLKPHPEGGWFKLVQLTEDRIPSPYLVGSGKPNRDSKRSLCSTIYYLLTPEWLELDDRDELKKMPSRHRNHAGYFHTNNATTVHTWHSGKAVYTLIKIPDFSSAESINDDSQRSNFVSKRIVMGDNIQAGETMVLTVPPGWWKRSETSSRDGHCLISETVTPAWATEDHAFMSPKDLERVCGNNHELYTAFRSHVLPEGHELDFA